jgi:glycogen debranching enzyme
VFYGSLNENSKPISGKPADNTKMGFHYDIKLKPGESRQIIQLIGMGRIKEQEDLIDKAIEYWPESVAQNEQRVYDYAFKNSHFNINDDALQNTMHWAKAVIASNSHYIDGQFLPMPCPAEYNFFFTHDLFLSSLGVVYFDTDYVKRGLMFLKSISKPDNILPHAYYWKDDRFVTEYCTKDNWNHFWFIIVSSAYLKHSNDQNTIRAILPLLKKSLEMALENKQTDNLMYAGRPDWWDIGNVYGARAYTTILMYKALRDYVYLASILGEDANHLLDYINMSQRMKKNLVDKLWDEDKAYLFNMLEKDKVDRHYYAGSILATHYELLDMERSKRLLQTVKKEILDPNLGVRTVMPADFHQLIDVYKFQGMEAGKPYFYLNGGVWPHLNVWYGLGLLFTGYVNEGKDVIKKYLTLEGIKNSPNGQPSFYEYRNTDAGTDHYGEIDKPTFLWAGGLYMHALYHARWI